MRTLIVFAKQPVPGQVKTRLAANWGADRAAGLYECFLRDLFERFRDAGDRRVAGYAANAGSARNWFEAAAPDWQLWPQPETGLGGRMATCFEQWCCQLADRTLLIGSDSPNLPGDSFERAWALLETHDVVLGPAADGGYWLVGLRGTSPQARGIFSGIDWSTPDVLRQTVERVHALQLSLALLPLWFDVDTEAEVAALRGMLAASDTPALPRTREFLQSMSEAEAG